MSEREVRDGGRELPPSRFAESPVTGRAVTIGLFFSLLVNLAMPYNDHYLYNTLLIGNHFPYIAITFVMLLVFVVNGGLARYFKVSGLAPGELLLIWSMIGVSGGICSAGLMRYLPTWIVVPTYYDRPENDFRQYVMDYLPDWMLVSRDPDSPAVRWYMEGMPSGGSIPWEAWIVPMGVWLIFMLLLYASNYAFIALFFKQWSVRERLVFPVIHLPLLLSEEPAAGSRLNAFLSNRLMWLGFAIPCLIWGVNGLHEYVSWFPRIPTSIWLWNLFPDRPWNEFHLQDAKLFFTVIGLTFLLTTEVSFSLWFFYVFYKLSYVFVAWIGAGGSGYWGNWATRINIFDHAGVLLALTGFLIWTARGFFKDWWKRVVSGKMDVNLDPMPPRWAFALLFFGVFGMIFWVMLSGTQWWVSVFIVLFFLATLLVLTRLVAEAGLIFVHVSTVTYDVMTGIVPANWLSGFSLGALLMQRGMLQDLREIFMPYVMNGLKAAEMVRMRIGKVLAVFALAAAISLGTSAYSRIVTGYKYGALNMDQWTTLQSPQWYIPAVAKFQKTPPAYDMTGPGNARILPVNAMHLLTGAGATLALLMLRAKFLWWPLHPAGLFMAPTWCLMNLWFSFFLGWLAKACVMTFGGAAVFRRVLPFFLGMALGESIMAAIWALVGLVSGVPGLAILPG